MANFPDRPLHIPDLSRDDQALTSQAMSGISENLTSRAATQAQSYRGSKHPTAAAMAVRLDTLAREGKDRRLTMAQAVNRRVEMFTRAATDMRKPEESIGGAGWYFDHHAEVDKALAGSAVEFSQGLGATGRLSIRTNPEDEKAALRGLAMGQTYGSVHFHDGLVSALKSVGHDVSHLAGTTQAFRDLPGKTVAAMTHPDIRDTVRASAHGVDIDAISRTTIRSNAGSAHEMMREGGRPNPVSNPKQFSYVESHTDAVPRSPEHQEYMARAAHIGATLRGEENGRQDMLDLWGLRASNSGILSNEHETAEDSWMNATTHGQKPSVFKAAGEIGLPNKRVGDKVIGNRQGNITPEGLQHAYNHEATVKASKKVQKDNGLNFTVPSVLMQEGTWYGARRSAPKRSNAQGSTADSDWNKHVAEQARSNRAASREEIRGQQGLF